MPRNNYIATIHLYQMKLTDPNGDLPTLRVSSHPSDSAFVVLETGEMRIVVFAADLEEALKRVSHGR
jgi:hypothetical protein